jgi:uncharacterized protein (TIGR03086 family)
MAQEPNVIELYEGAVQNMLPILGGIRENQLTASTPCTEWNVQNLVIHNIKVTGFAQGIIRGNNAVDAMDVIGQVPSEGAVDAFVTGTNGVLDLLKNSADLGEVIETPFGKMPIAHFIMFPTLDIVIHKWDLAKGTGQNTDIDAGLAEATYGALQTGAELGRQFGIFAAEVEIPISASIQEKLLAISGRMP